MTQRRTSLFVLLLISNSLVLMLLAVLPPNYLYGIYAKGDWKLEIPRVGTLFLETTKRVTIQKDSLELPATLHTVLQPYELKMQMPEIRFKNGAEMIPLFQKFQFPSYRAEEMITAVRIPRNSIPGEYQLQQDLAGTAPYAIEIRPVGFSKKFFKFLPQSLWHFHKWLPMIMLLLPILLNSLSSVIESRSHNADICFRPFVFLFLILTVIAKPHIGAMEDWIHLHLRLTHYIEKLLPSVAFALLLPWGLFKKKVGKNIPTRFYAPPEPLIYLSILVTLVVFAFTLMRFGTSYRWSVFEERDYLIARRVASLSFFPVLGPQLLAGGQMPGGLLYFLLAPLTKLGQTSYIFAIYNRIGYFFAALVFFTICKRYLGLFPSALALFFFCTSEIVLALSNWPIHPSMSVLFYLIFVYFMLRFTLDRDRFAGVMASFFLAVLIQLHFTYLVLLIPFTVLMVLHPVLEKRRSFYAAVLTALLFMFIPYLISEFLTGFSNWRLMAMKPRFHPIYVEIHQGFERPMIWTILDWFVLLTPNLVFRLLLWLFVIGMTLYGMVESLDTEDQAHERWGKVLSILILIPFAFILLLGWGVNYRHTISFAPGFFIFAAYGVDRILNKNKIRHYIFLTLMIAAIGSYAAGMASPELLARTFNTTKVGEWTVDFREREAEVNYLIEDLGITPDQYRKQVFWESMTWSMAPEIYSDLVASHLKEGKTLPPSKLGTDKTLFLFRGKPPEQFEKFFTFKDWGKRGQIEYYVGSPKIASSPITNSRNTASLNPLEARIELLQLGNVVRKTVQAPGSESYIVSFHQGRLRLQFDFDWKEEKGDSILKWSIVSPHFNGYYQEIKTLWKPALILKNTSGKKDVEIPLSSFDTLGFLRVTPLEGEVHLSGQPAQWIKKFKIDGYFDQSSMPEPVLANREWDLN